MKRTLPLLALLLFCLQAAAQIIPEKHFSKIDSLIGQQSPERTAYDINYYHLDIRIDPEERSISGQNLFRFTTTRDCSRLQFELFENMKIDKVVYKGEEVSFNRIYNTVYLNFREPIKKGTKSEFTVFYSGKPIQAANAPWDGGFIFKKDAAGKPWVSVAVQGVGASLWWPNKDQQSDEVDSMLISIAVPDSLIDISNGQYRGKQNLQDGYTRYNWFVSYPINNYNVTVNIGDFAHITDTFTGIKGELKLDYYVLRENQAKAKKHFRGNVQAMLSCFEYWLGPYPFYHDGYKLIESPYLGMEHQSAIAYGNQYKNGYLGSDNSGTGYGKEWDFIIIHESAHEWFGNNVTAKDIADSWIHEAFATYAEATFVECRDGKKAAAAYIKGLRNNIQNEYPMIGYYGVNDRGTTDIYYKGANILQTIRTIINDDEKWRHILRGINAQFSLQTVTTENIIDYINKIAGKNLTAVFSTYLEHSSIPILEFRKSNGITEYRWNAAEEDFNMPVRIKFIDEHNWHSIHPTSSWEKLNKNKKFSIDTDNMYFNTAFD